MFHSLSRPVVSAVLVLAVLLAAVPAQAQPRDLGSSSALDTSWLETALSWLDSLLGDNSAVYDKQEEEGIDARFMTGVCIDPSGGCLGN